MIDITKYGAAGQGDDTGAVTRAFMDALTRGAPLYIPAGSYRVRGPLVAAAIKSNLAIFGDGENVSSLVFDSCAGLSLSFLQEGLQQPWGLSMRGLSLKAQGSCGKALAVSYGTPALTNDHFRPSVALSDFRVESSNQGTWGDGIEIEGAWNPTLSNVCVSGDPHGGNWNLMSGAGINLKGMCVNAHLANVRANFWATGLMAHANGGLNTEGIFCSNCSMVGVKRGVWIAGNSANTGRISTLTWNGGMIEARVKGVTGGSAAFHLQNVWTALISGAQLIADTISENVEETYGLFLDTCSGVVISGCDINAWRTGVFTMGDCRAITVAHASYTNCPRQLVFCPGTSGSRSVSPVLFNDRRSETDLDGRNLLQP